MKTCLKVVGWVGVGLIGLVLVVWILTQGSIQDSGRFPASSKPVAVATRNPRGKTMSKVDIVVTRHQQMLVDYASGLRDGQAQWQLHDFLDELSNVFTKQDRLLFPKSARLLAMLDKDCTGKTLGLYEQSSCLVLADQYLGMLLSEYEGK